jgi:hypothetical protein
LGTRGHYRAPAAAAAPGRGPSFDRDHPLDPDLIVVDEASMLDLILANKLIKAVPAGRTCCWSAKAIARPTSASLIRVDHTLDAGQTAGQVGKAQLSRRAGATGARHLTSAAGVTPMRFLGCPQTRARACLEAALVDSIR